jgi:hypothetical protein
VTRSAGRGRASHSRFTQAGPTAFVSALSLVWGAALATQYVAAVIGHHRHLGGWLFSASAASRPTFVLAMIVGDIAVLLALASYDWQWACIPLALVTASVQAVVAGPIYSPAALLRWYTVHNTVATDRAVFRFAWLIIAAVVVLLTTAEHRLRRTVKHKVARAIVALRRPAPVDRSRWPGRAVLIGGYPEPDPAPDGDAIRAVLREARPARDPAVDPSDPLHALPSGA